MEDFGRMLRRLRRERGYSLRRFADVAGIDFGYVGQIERGERRCSEQWAEICDTTLRAGGALIETYRRGNIEEGEVRRRTVLGAMTAAPPLLAFEVLGRNAPPTMGAEAVRHDLLSALDGQSVDMDEWDEIAWNYGCTYADTPPATLLDGLREDLLIARMQLDRLPTEEARRPLQQVVARLALFMAQTLGNLGDLRSSQRWWRTARRYADRSASDDVRVWVLGRAVIRGIYERRAPAALLSLADEGTAVSASPTAGRCGLLGGRAQVLAMLGSDKEARDSLAALHDTFSQLPAAIVNDTVSLCGYPEFRLRHAESFTYTYLGDHTKADAAREALDALYPAHMFREHTQIELHRAIRLVRAGGVNAGINHACEAVDALPRAQRIEGVLVLARSVADYAAEADPRHTKVTELRRLAALPAGPAQEA